MAAQLAMCLGASSQAMDEALPRLRLSGSVDLQPPGAANGKEGLQWRRAQFRTGAMALSLKCDHMPENHFVDLKDLKIPDPDSQRHLSQYKVQTSLQDPA